MLVASLLLVAAVLVALLAPSSGSPRVATGRAQQRAQRPPRLVTRLVSARLPAAVSGETALTQGEGVLVIGGLDASDVSTAAVTELRPAGAKLVPAGSLSQPRHDTAAAVLAGNVLVFGGGSVAELDSIESLRRGGAGQVIGRLPSTRSDLSAVTIGARAYVLGGYGGQSPLAAVLQTADGLSFATVASLPVPFRYAAVVAVGQTIYTFGGELASGSDTDAIQAIETGTGRARVVGRLSHPLSHASAVLLGGRIYLLGGTVRERATSAIVSFDPSTSTVRPAGRLPFAVTNAAADQVGGIGYLIGGLNAAGASLDTVVEIRLAG